MWLEILPGSTIIDHLARSCVAVATNDSTTPCLAAALTVAGQWRNYTAFPSILAIAIVGLRGFWRRAAHYGMKAIFMS